VWECRGEQKHPKRQFTVKVGTIFEDSPIPLKSWLLATWMIVNCKNGVSSYEISRAIGVTQKATWHMLHRIRLAMQAADGGKARNMHANRRKQRGRSAWVGKSAVMGLLQRHEGKGKSRVRVEVVPSTRRHQLHSRVEKHVEDGSTVYTDALPSYNHLSVYYQHQVIDHAEAYVRDSCHTNGLENFWALLKRSINGTYVSVEPFHLHRYLDEQARRFNERDLTDGERFRATLKSVVGRRLTWAEVTGRELPA
jgi:transposase-like protein